MKQNSNGLSLSQLNKLRFYHIVEDFACEIEDNYIENFHIKVLATPDNLLDVIYENEIHETVRNIVEEYNDYRSNYDEVDFLYQAVIAYIEGFKEMRELAAFLEIIYKEIPEYEGFMGKDIESIWQKYYDLKAEDFELPYFGDIIDLLGLLFYWGFICTRYQEQLKGIKTKHYNLNKKERFTYSWTGRKCELKELFTKIKPYISADNKLQDFKNVFLARPVEEISTPIRWKKDIPSQVIFFLMELMERGLIHQENRFSYKRMKICFTKPDGTEFNQNLKNLKQNMTVNLASKTQDDIRQIVEYFI